jgi:hypothetical protein
VTEQSQSDVDRNVRPRRGRFAGREPFYLFSIGSAGSFAHSPSACHTASGRRTQADAAGADRA